VLETRHEAGCPRTIDFSGWMPWTSDLPNSVKKKKKKKKKKQTQKKKKQNKKKKPIHGVRISRKVRVELFRVSVRK
jgi:hypothetical protein